MKPSSTGIKVDQAAREHADLNQRFRDGELLDKRFYAQLSERGCVVNECVLVNLVPDGDETYFGTIIRQDGRVFDFDLALANSSGSEWDDKTEPFLHDYDRDRRSQPWLPNVIAYGMFMNDRRARSQSS